MSWDEASFLEKLEGTHQFPSKYTFKFIVKPEHQKTVESLVKNAEIKLKPSSGNKYVSISIIAQMASSESVVNVYKRAHTIEGIIAL